MNITCFMGLLRINGISTTWLRSAMHEDDLGIILVFCHCYNKLS